MNCYYCGTEMTEKEYFSHPFDRTFCSPSCLQEYSGSDYDDNDLSEQDLDNMFDKDLLLNDDVMILSDDYTDEADDC